jgi:uncharacterized membrane protein
MATRRTAKRREENEVEFSRIVAFSDGVFAIAITLLVLNFEISHTLPGDQIDNALWSQRENLLVYAISFAVIGRFWFIHHRFFGEVTAFDSRLIALNLLYLGWIVLIPFSSEVLGEYGGHTAAVVLYSANLFGVVLIGLWMTADAHHGGLTAADEAVRRESRDRAVYIAAVFLVSIPIAFVAPTVTPLIWLVLFLGRSAAVPSRASRGASS